MQTIEEQAATIAFQLRPVYEVPLLCEQYAWWILEAIIGKSKAELLADDRIAISEDQRVLINDWLHKLIIDQMPLAYLIGSVPFNGLTILVEPPVLIPRPETEEWTVNLIEQLKTLEHQRLTILDLCTGTGCIALALAQAFPHASIYALDISQQALQCAQKNIARLLISNVALIQSDLFNALNPGLRFDLIVGNPPYIPSHEWSELDEQVTAWEDKNALIAADEGFSVLARIMQEAPQFLKSNNEMDAKKIPQLLLEMDETQGKRATELMQQWGYCDIQVLKDLAGKDRVITGRYAPCGHLGE